MFLRVLLSIAISIANLPLVHAQQSEIDQVQSLNIWAGFIQVAIESLDLGRLARLRAGKQISTNNANENFLLSLERAISSLDSVTLNHIIAAREKPNLKAGPQIDDIEKVTDLLVGARTSLQNDPSLNLTDIMKVIYHVDMTSEIFQALRARYPEVIDRIAKNNFDTSLMDAPKDTDLSMDAHQPTTAQMLTIAALHFYKESQAGNNNLQKALGLLISYGIIKEHANQLKAVIEHAPDKLLEPTQDLFKDKPLHELIANSEGAPKFKSNLFNQHPLIDATVAFLQWEDGSTNAAEVLAARDLQEYYKSQQTNILACGLKELGALVAKDSVRCEDLSEVPVPTKFSVLTEKMSLRGIGVMASTAVAFLMATTMVVAVQQAFPTISLVSTVALLSAALAGQGYLIVKVFKNLPENSQEKRDFILALHSLGITDPKNFHQELAKRLTAPNFRSCEYLLKSTIQEKVNALHK